MAISVFDEQGRKLVVNEFISLAAINRPVVTERRLRQSFFSAMPSWYNWRFRVFTSYTAIC